MNTRLRFGLIIIIVFAVFFVFLNLGMLKLTGLAVIDDKKIIADGKIYVFDFSKNKDSLINIKASSSLNSDFYLALDCDKWKNQEIGEALYTLAEDVKEINEDCCNNKQQIDIYNTDKLCLVILNKEYPDKEINRINIKIEQLK